MWRCKKCGGLVLAGMKNQTLDQTYAEIDFYQCQKCGCKTKEGIKNIAEWIGKQKLKDYEKEYVFVRISGGHCKLIPTKEVLEYIKTNSFLGIYGVKNHKCITNINEKSKNLYMMIWIMRVMKMKPKI